MYLISVVMPSYNSASTINNSIESVLNQTYLNWELIVCDDNSTDNTLSILDSYASQDSRIKVLKNSKNLGAAQSRNLCINASVGRFIAFLDSDDLWLETKLEEQVDFMLKNNFAFTYTFYQKLLSANNLGGVVTSPIKVSYSELLKSNVIGCLTVMIDTSVLGKPIFPDIRKRQDFALWLKILRYGGYATCLPKVLAYYRVGVGISSNKFSVLSYQWRLYRDIENLPLLKVISLMLHYSLKGVLKYFK